MIREALLERARDPLAYITAALIASIVFFSVKAPDFMTSVNLRDLGAGSAGLGIVAIGVTLALASGAIDFSIAGTAALVGVIVARVDAGRPAVLALLVGLLVAVLIGLLNGVVVVYFRVNAFIATLAAGGAYRGIAYLLSGASVGVGLEDGFVAQLGQGTLLGLPNPIWILAAVGVVAFVVLRSTRFGRSLLAVGGNVEAARLTGFRVVTLQLSGYVIAAVTAGLCGVILAGRSTFAIPSAATGTELLVFSMVLLGGTSLWGGRASVLGTVLGVLFLNVVYNGLVLEGVSSYWQTILQGVLLIIAVYLVQARGGQDLGDGLLQRALASRRLRATVASVSPAAHSAPETFPLDPDSSSDGSDASS
jgi:ribose transport system permease protein